MRDAKGETMGLKDELASDMKSAMRSGDKLRLSTIRLLLSEFKNAEIAKGVELSDEEAVEIVQRQIKKRREAISQYRKGGREDLAEKEEAEADILERYLPEQLTDEEIISAIEEAISQTGAASKKEMGKVMGAVMSKIKGRADGARVSRLVSQLLAD